VIDKPTATKNLRLGLILAIFSVALVAATLLIGVIVTHG
jgi:hypothetical protein